LRLRALPPDAPPTGPARAAGETRFGLEVRLEPRLRLQAVLALRGDRAIDDQGRILTQPAAGIAGAGALAGGPGEEGLLALRGRGLPVPPPVRAGQLTLLDGRGRKVPPAGSPVPAVGSGGAAWDFTLVYQPTADQGEPARLVYTGRRTVTLEVPFTLEDVPLP